MTARDNNDVIDVTPEHQYPDYDDEPDSGSLSAKVMLVTAILILIAVIGAMTYAWQYWEQAKQELVELNHQIEQTRSQQQQLKASVSETNAEIEQQKQHIQAQQQKIQGQQQQIETERAQVKVLNASVTKSSEQFNSSEQQLKQRVEETEVRLAGSPHRWIAAEARHLLRVAGQKLRYQHNVGAAIEALEEASTLLSKGGTEFNHTRLLLDQEINNLQQLKLPDRATLQKQLYKLNKDINTLPLKKVVYNKDEKSADTTPTETSADSDWRNMAESGLTRLKSLVQITHHQQGEHPGITALQEELIRQHLRLALDNARIALQREENSMYQGALLLAGELFDYYFDNSTAGARVFQASIQSLQATDISPPLPRSEETLKQLTAMLNTQFEGSAR